MGFGRASGCKYPKCNHCGHDKILDDPHCHDPTIRRWCCELHCPPSTEVVEGTGCEGLEVKIFIRLKPRSIILCLLTLGVVAVLTLLVIKCIGLSLNI